jgi:cell division protein FtsB
MPPAADAPPRTATTPASGRGAGTPASPRRTATATSTKRPGRISRLLRPALLLITLVLVADALVGENGWFEHQREQARLAEVVKKRDEAQRLNAALTQRRDRLTAKDPALIEDLARRNLGMLKSGEYVFIDGTEGRTAPGSAADRR